MTAALALTRARLWTPDTLDPPLVDVSIDDGRIASVVPTGSERLATRDRVDLDGRWLMPGLVDHHVHFTLWSQHRGRLDVSQATSAAHTAAMVREALVRDSRDADAATAPLVGRGFQDALWPDAPTAALLDSAAVAAGTPYRAIVLISHDLHSVWVNSAAAVRLEVAAGLLREDAAFAVEIAVGDWAAESPEAVERAVDHAVTTANARGVTGIMDLEMADNPAVWGARFARGVCGLRVRAGVYPQHLEATVSRGERTGKRLPGTCGLISVGPLKLFSDGALNTRTAWCFDPYPHTEDYGHAAHARGDLVRLVADARHLGFDVALHAMGDRAVSEALDAFESTGARGTIEHAQLVREADIERFARLRVGAGIHPEHALDDRDVADAIWEGRTSRAFAFGALARAGVRLHMGSDAPVAPLDPWRSISAAVFRTRDDAPPWELHNALSIDQALRASWAMGSVAPDSLADLIAVDEDPRALDAQALRTMPVAVTLVAGAVVHEAL